MRELTLQEWQASEPHSLTTSQLSALRSLKISIDPDVDGKWTLTPGSTIGAVEVGNLAVLIQPKIHMPQLLSLACYAIDNVKFQTSDFDFPEERALPDVLALALGKAARRAFSRGLLHGYLAREEALAIVRGRIRFNEQFRRRPGIFLPIEIRYDEFTDDILANRLVKAAAIRLMRAGLRSPRARNEVRWVAGMLDNVSLCEWPPNSVPEVTFDHLNEHYRAAVTLSRLVLRHGELQAHRGSVRTSGFLMNMNAIFQEFVTVALREALGLSENDFKECDIPKLDTGKRVRLRPDLVWLHAGRYVFVGDVKYKRIVSDAPNADLYQILAYTTSLDLPGGLLVYAEGEREPATYTIRNSGKHLEVATLDLSGSLEDVLERVRNVARMVLRLRNEVGGLRNVA